ncbi:MAG: serine/threonine-protein kinase [Phycisphaerae bacterium]
MSGEISDSAINHLRRVAQWPDMSQTRYELIEMIGRGGMGEVYLVRDRELGREVAMKVLRDMAVDPKADERLRREARVMSGLEHPGIVPLHDAGRLPDGRAYYVMKRVRGRRLDQVVSDQLPLAERLRLFQQICETVAFAHARGVIHRDLKPQNVMVGEFGEVLVLDWGAAKLLSLQTSDPSAAGQSEREAPAREAGADPAGASADDAACADRGQSAAALAGASRSVATGPDATDADRTRTNQTTHGTILGTPAYMPPEQARGEIERIDQRSDVYALGAILYFLLTGAAPAQPTNRAEADARLPGAAPGLSATTIASPRTRNPSTPRAMEAVCLKALSTDPAARYTSAIELREEISRFLAEGAVRAYREPLGERAARFFRTYRTPIALVAAYLVIRFVLVFWPGG